MWVKTSCWSNSFSHFSLGWGWWSLVPMWKPPSCYSCYFVKIWVLLLWNGCWATHLTGMKPLASPGELLLLTRHQSVILCQIKLHEKTQPWGVEHLAVGLYKKLPLFLLLLFGSPSLSVFLPFSPFHALIHCSRSFPSSQTGSEALHKNVGRGRKISE